MLKVFVKTNCIGSKKAEEFLAKNDIRYDRFNLSFTPLNEDDLYWMFKITESVIELVNPNSEEFLKDPTLKERFLQMDVKEQISTIINNPNLLSYPIGLQFDSLNHAKTLIVGFIDSQWIMFQKDAGFQNYYYNANNSFLFKTCCFYDEVKNDEINMFEIDSWNEK